ncbi:DNA-binding FadR family transcriptional regulator [Pararhizobium capsulatum DSM 1112]|uniref:DNA-binding FadR family transcriptional regulator n=2 Tax=Pararhizobium capsulatum TaxID=34014 RepID=A0ABU0BK53_9HYPH|nr:DNA-binding FadR family transcriptional regulator [Pararhizobium capsulatum DSM 1112]
MTVYRRPDPIPRASAPREIGSALTPLREQNVDLNQLAAKQIFMAIVSKQWGANGYLPKEDELGEQLRVSRTVIREATKYLAAKSVVETRRRRGTAILDTQSWNLIDREITAWISESRQFPHFGEDLLGVLAHTQPALAERVALMRPSTVAALPEIAAQIKTAPNEERGDLILEFHERIAVAAGNPFLRSLTANAVEGLRVHHRGVLGAFVQSCRMADYSDTAAAISNGDGDKAKQILHAVFARASGRVDRLSPGRVADLA